MDNENVDKLNCPGGFFVSCCAVSFIRKYNFGKFLEK